METLAAVLADGHGAVNALNLLIWVGVIVLIVALVVFLIRRL